MVVKDFFKKILELCKDGYSYIKNSIKTWLIKKIEEGKIPFKIEKKSVEITKIPEDERVKLILADYFRLKAEYETLRKRVEELEEKLQEKRVEKLAEVIKEVIKKEKAGEAISLTDLVKKLRLKAIFRRPIKVFMADHSYWGDLEDIEVVGGGMRLVIKTPDKKREYSPIYIAFSEMFVDPDHAHEYIKQGIIIANAIRTSDGDVVKLPPHLINPTIYGLEYKKVLAEYEKRYHEILVEYQREKMRNAVMWMDNIKDKIEKQTAEFTAMAALNLFEEKEKTFRTSFLPAFLAQLATSDILYVQLDKARRTAEAAVQEMTKLYGELEALKRSTAPERILVSMMAQLDKMDQIINTLINIISRLKEGGGGGGRGAAT